MKKRILQTIGGFNANFGGTSTCTCDLMMALNELDSDYQVDLLAPCTRNMIVNNEDWLKTVPCDYKTYLCLSKNISKFLSSSNYDIYHTNGLWMHVNHTTCEIARKKGKPYLITPHGTLYPQALSRGYWKKFPFLKLWFERDIKYAACLHATCVQEVEYLREFGYLGPVALIPNPVSIPDYTLEIYNKRKYPHNIRLGYLGRLHPRKKVENILYGLAESKMIDAEVIIMGTGDKDYERFLRSEAVRIGLENNVKFEGFVKGRQKFEILASLSALIVPSDFENFGMIIPEALIVGTPVFASLGTPWKSLEREVCGWWKSNSVDSISRFVLDLKQLDSSELKEMGGTGRRFIEREFSPFKIAEKTFELYGWISGECARPSFVFT